MSAVDEVQFNDLNWERNVSILFHLLLHEARFQRS